MGVVETVVLSTLFGGCGSIICGEMICAENSNFCNPIFTYCPFWNKCFIKSTGNGICNCKCILCYTCYTCCTLYMLKCKNNLCCMNNNISIGIQEVNEHEQTNEVVQEQEQEQEQNQNQTQYDIIDIPPSSMYILEPYKQNNLTYGESIPTYQETILEYDYCIPKYDDHINYCIKS